MVEQVSDTLVEPEDELVMKFDPNTIQHLGVQMYSTLPPVIAEVVANSYDADAENVTIFLNDLDEKEIIIRDDGHGIAWEEINPKFLLIGKNRRERDGTGLSQIKKRPLIGKKGLGKLSFFGIANLITIKTVKESTLNAFSMNLNDLRKSKEEYRPKILKKNEKVDGKNGTTVQLSELKRKSSFSPEDIARYLSRSFTVFDQEDFHVEIIHNNSDVTKVTDKLKYENIPIQFKWDFPIEDEEIVAKLPQYEYSSKIGGAIISAGKTVPSYMRGVALISRGKLVNDHSFYDNKATSHGYSYITGWLNISFIDEWDRDVISTNRKSLNWEDEDTIILKDYLNKVISYIYNKQRELRAEKKKEEIKKVTGLDIDEWIGTLPKHDGNLARKIVDTIVKSEELDEQKAGDLVTYVKDSFQFESFKEFAAEMDDITEISDENLLKLLQDWKLIEAREFYKLSLVRVETIKKFEDYIRQDAKEVPTIHDFLKSFPWLLDPKIIEFRDEVYYSKLLRENFPDSDEQLEANRRIDFLCMGLANNYFIIELKRPRHTIREKDILQANAYRSFVAKLQGSDPYSVTKIVAYIVCGKRSNIPRVESLVNQVQSSGEIYVKTYHELLTSAKNYHKEFIDKYVELQKTKTLPAEN